MKWMVQDAEINGENKVISRAVRKFPKLFRQSTKANLQKSSRWWKSRHNLLQNTQPKSTYRMQQGVTKKKHCKALAGRGRKRAAWVLFLHDELVEEFRRFSKAGVSFDSSMLRNVALDILDSSDSVFNSTYLDPVDNKPIKEKITCRWIQSFLERMQIVLKVPSGKPLLNDKKTEFVHRSVAYHLGIVCTRFREKSLDPDMCENIDETHLIIDMKKPRVLGFKGEGSLKYADVVSGGESMTLALRISGGVDSRLHPPFLIFQNDRRSYPIRGVDDNIPGVCYRSSPKGWMDRITFKEYLKEPRAFSPHPYGRKKHVFLDNCTSHMPDAELENWLDENKIELLFLPKNATDLCQPLDSFIIKCFKEEWKKRWDEKKFQMITSGDWKDQGTGRAGWSGKLNNPGKKFFLKLAADCARAVNSRRDETGMTFARKAMTRCGLGVDENGRWSIDQLYPHLKEIILRYRENFEGQEPDMDD